MDTWYDTAPTPDGNEPGGLLIPDKAWYAAMYMVEDSGRGAISPIIEAAAPYIVAAELRRIAAAYDEWHREGADELRRGERSHKALVSAYAVRDQLLARASELDGAR